MTSFLKTGPSDEAMLRERIGASPARPTLKSSAPQREKGAPMSADALEEYAKFAKELGVAVPDLHIEQFKHFLIVNGITVFNLAEVVKYMDVKADAESKDKAGWHWKPLREKDKKLFSGVTFGQSAQHTSWNGRGDLVYRRGSDCWDSANLIYSRTVPLHALKKVAKIEKEFTHAPVGFFVADYAPAPQIMNPDPFLMACLYNVRLDVGVGRFIIDFWDEPGFGLEQQLASP